MKIRAGFIGMLALALGGVGCAQKVGDVLKGGDRAEVEQTGWVTGHVSSIDQEAGTVSFQLAEAPEGDIELQAGQEFTVEIEYLDELTGLDEEPEAILERLSLLEEMQLRLQGSGDDFEIREIDPAFLE